MKYTQFYKMRIPEGHDYYDVEDFNSNTQTIDAELNKLNNMVGHGCSETTVTLTASNWDENNQQTITIDGVTDDSVVILGTPTGVSATVYNAISMARIVVLSISGNSLVLKVYGQKPSINISISVVVM